MAAFDHDILFIYVVLVFSLIIAHKIYSEFFMLGPVFYTIPHITQYLWRAAFHHDMLFIHVVQH